MLVRALSTAATNVPFLLHLAHVSYQAGQNRISIYTPCIYVLYIYGCIILPCICICMTVYSHIYIQIRTVQIQMYINIIFEYRASSKATEWPPLKISYEKVECSYIRFTYGFTEYTYIYGLYGVYIRTRKSHLQSWPTYIYVFISPCSVTVLTFKSTLGLTWVRGWGYRSIWVNFGVSGGARTNCWKATPCCEPSLVQFWCKMCNLIRYG